MICLRSDDKDDDNDLIPFNLVQFNLMPQFGFLDFSSFDSLLARFRLMTVLSPPQLLQTFFACWHNAESEIGSEIKENYDDDDVIEQIVEQQKQAKKKTPHNNVNANRKLISFCTLYMDMKIHYICHSVLSISNEKVNIFVGTPYQIARKSLMSFS